MKNDEFETVVNDQIRRCTDTLIVKAREYATEDRLHNFKTASKIEHCTPVGALGGMMAKHTVSIYDMIADVDNGKTYPLSLWNEKIGDSINYLLLLAAMIRDNDPPTKQDNSL